MIIRGGSMDSRIQKMEIVDDRVAEILRSKTPAERLAIADGMWWFARRMIREIVAREHPDWSEAEINRQVARRMSHGAF
jgi:hypothetical protein